MAFPAYLRHRYTPLPTHAVTRSRASSRIITRTHIRTPAPSTTLPSFRSLPIQPAHILTFHLTYYDSITTDTRTHIASYTIQVHPLRAKRRFDLRFDTQPSDLVRACSNIHFSMLRLERIRFRHILTFQLKPYRMHAQMHISEKIFCTQPLGAVPLDPNHHKNITAARI